MNVVKKLVIGLLVLLLAFGFAVGGCFVGSRLGSAERERLSELIAVRDADLELTRSNARRITEQCGIIGDGIGSVIVEAGKITDRNKRIVALIEGIRVAARQLREIESRIDERDYKNTTEP
jgi:hypothetical protein